MKGLRKEGIKPYIFMKLQIAIVSITKVLTLSFSLTLFIKMINIKTTENIYFTVKNPYILGTQKNGVVALLIFLCFFPDQRVRT